jgi:hypothetical protein
MLRNCLIAVILYPLLFGGYAWVLREALKTPDRWIVAAIAAAVSWLGLLLVNGARYDVRAWRAQRRAREQGTPDDGDLFAAVGPVASRGTALKAPFSGRDCVGYLYEVGPPRDGEASARDWFGFAFAPFAVQTPAGEVMVDSMPVFEQIDKESIEGPEECERARAYVASTQFERIGGADIIKLSKTVLGAHSGRGATRKDFHVGDATELDRGMEIIEQRLEPGTPVTITGRWDSASHAIVADKSQGYVQLKIGTTLADDSAFPSGAFVKFVFGLLLATAPAAVALYVTGQLPAFLR